MQKSSVHKMMEHMIQTEHKHRAICDRELSHLGLYRSRLRMLMRLWRGGGEMTQHQLAAEMHITPAVVTVTLQKLEAEGYVVRNTSFEDRRTIQVALTPLGEKTVTEAHGTLEDIDTAMFSGFSEQDKAMLISFYERMLANLKQFEEVRA